MAELKPCPKCGGKGDEMIGYGYPLFICGINTGVELGHIIFAKNANTEHKPIMNRVVLLMNGTGGLK